MYMHMLTKQIISDCNTVIKEVRVAADGDWVVKVQKKNILKLLTGDREKVKYKTDVFDEQLMKNVRRYPHLSNPSQREHGYF